MPGIQTRVVEMNS